jgi:hypothetical protein
LDRNVALKYVNKKKRRKRAAIISGISVIGLTIFIIIAFCMMSVDRFTITTSNEPELTLTIDEDKLKQTTTLTAPPLLHATDTQYSEIPETVDEGLGSKNTDYYFAYSFYLGGSGKQETINYNLALSLERYSNNLEDAIRVMIIRNSHRPKVYAKADSNGDEKPIYSGDKNVPEEKEIIGYAEPFRKNKYIIVETYEIVPGEFDKYTIVIWIDGWESVNSMKGGVFSANIKFSTHSIND